MRGGTRLGHLPLPLLPTLVGWSCNRSDDDDDDDCRFVAGATVIHTTVCRQPLGSADQSASQTLTDGWSAHSRTDGQESTRAEQMKNGLVPRWLFHWLVASSGIAARQIVVMATRRRRLPASLLLEAVVMDVHHESTFSAFTAHNFTDLNQADVTWRHDRIRHPIRDLSNYHARCIGLLQLKRTAHQLTLSYNYEPGKIADSCFFIRHLYYLHNVKLRNSADQPADLCQVLAILLDIRFDY